MSKRDVALEEKELGRHRLNIKWLFAVFKLTGMPVFRLYWIQALAIYFQAICFIFLCTNWTILDSFQTHSCFLIGNPEVKHLSIFSNIGLSALNIQTYSIRKHWKHSDVIKKKIKIYHNWHSIQYEVRLAMTCCGVNNQHCHVCQ